MNKCLLALTCSILLGSSLPFVHAQETGGEPKTPAQTAAPVAPAAAPTTTSYCDTSGCTTVTTSTQQASGQIQADGGTAVNPPVQSPPDQATQIRSGDGRPAQQAGGIGTTGTSAAARTTLQQQVVRRTDRPTDFQNYVETSTGHPLRPYGADLFNGTAGDLGTAASVAAPADYVLGPGDQVRVRAWGNVSIDVDATVDRNGAIYIPQVGTLQVAGMRLSDLQGYVRSAISRQFRNFELSVTIGQLRSIQVFVLGEARIPGVHTISSLSTLLNALFAAGGPLPTGSLRDIQLKRGGQTIAHLDVYDLLLEGDKHADVHLQAGDIVFVPVIGPQAAVDGDVNKPAIYELRGQTSVDELLRLAGGLSPIATTDRASLDRIVNHDHREVQDFPLTGAQRLIQVQGGDLLRVFPISPQFDKAVTLAGNVGQPGRYPWHPGMRISDLIPSRQFLITRRYFNRQNALTPPIPAHPFDAQTNTEQSASNVRTSAISQDQAAAAATAAIANVSGGSANPGSELGNHDTEINWNYATIERLDPRDLKTNLISFSLGEAVDHPNSADDQALQAGDVVTVYSHNDINLPAELRTRFVRIDGEVVRPGVYRVEGEETLRDLVSRAGGIAPHGYLYASQFTRESVRIAENAKLQQVVQQAMRDVLAPSNQEIGPDGRTNTGDLEMRRAYVQALGQIHATGRVTLQIPPGANGLADVPAVALQDGDRFFVPPRPNTVDVLGNVFNPGALLYTRDASVRHYLNISGQRTRTGDKSQEFLLRADGTVLSRETHARFDKLMVYPGDTIIVPARLKPGFNPYLFLNYTQAASGLALSALAIRALE